MANDANPEAHWRLRDRLLWVEFTNSIASRNGGSRRKTGSTEPLD
jgi:hypothetical protein